MTDELNSLIAGATGGEPGNDAADSLLSPEMLEAVRTSGTKKPPTAKRTPEPESVPPLGDDGDDDDETPEPAPRPRQRGKFAGYRKHEIEAEAERLSQQLEEMQRAAAEKKAEPDPNALRDLAFTIEFAARLGFKAASLMRGPHWEITDPEAETIGETGAIALAPMAAEYAHMLPWINFAAALGQPIGSRIAEDRRIARLQEIPPDAP